MQCGIFKLIGLALFFILFNTFFSLNAAADKINLRSKFEQITSDSDITDKTTGEVLHSTFSALNQQYNLDISKTIFPYLTFSGGTLYELDRSESSFEGTETNIDETLLRPYLQLNLDNPFYKAGLEYRRDQLENRTTGLPDTENFRDEFNTILGWKPSDLPEFNLRHSSTHFYNNLDTLDRLENQLTFDTNYTIRQKLQLNYFYSRLTSENNLTDSETITQNQNGRVDYSDNFFNNRVSVSTSYRIHYSSFEFPTIDSVDASLLRSSGLSSLNNTPEDGPALSINSALIDGNLTASSGINIGLSADETTLVNIGLDFGFSVEVQKIRIWIDRHLPSSVANSFSWSVYTSPDNTDSSTWTLQATVFPADFGIFENRFDISFAKVNTRFIKVVVRPLLATVTGASLFPNIFVTEMEAFTTQSSVTGENKTSTIDHNYNLNLIGRLSDRTVLGYNLFYRLQEQDPTSEKRTELTNGIYARHIINRIFSASTNLSQTDTDLNGDKSAIYNYSASVKAAYLETLGQILSFSGSSTNEDEGSSSTNSLFLRSNAKLYDGWSAFLDLGYTWDRPLGSSETTSTIIRSGTNIVPNEKINITVNYSVTKTLQSDEDSAKNNKSEWDIQALFTPYGGISLSARYNISDRETSKTSFQNYSVNWSPFPDGDLQFFFTYDETLRPEEGLKDTSFGPGLTWALGRHFFLDLSYSFVNSETTLQTIDSNTIHTTLRINF